MYRQDGLVFDFAAPAFWREGEPLTLSLTEQRLLRLLVENRGCTLPRSLLLERVWGSEFVEENALSVTVRRLREKPGAGHDKRPSGKAEFRFPEGRFARVVLP